MTGRDFEPGDVIVRVFPKGGERRWTVDSPVRTSHGKLRLRTATGGIVTAWWTPDRIGNPTGTYRVEHAAARTLREASS